MFALFLALASMEPELPPVIILIPEASATASIAAAHLKAELATAARVEAEGTGDVSAIAARARTAWPEFWVIVLDAAKHEAILLRPNDRPLLVRTLPERSEPYALAVAAAELVRLAMLDTVPKSSPPPERSPIVQPARENELGLAASIGLSAAGTFGDERVLLQPTLGFDVRSSSEDFLTSAGVRVRGPASVQLERASEVALEYRRTDLSARLGFGPKLGDFILTASLQAGVSFTRTRARRGATVLGSAARTPFWVGAGGDVEYALWSSLRAVASVEVGRVLAPADFIGGDEIIYSEGAIRVLGTASLQWVLE